MIIRVILEDNNASMEFVLKHAEYSVSADKIGIRKQNRKLESELVGIKQVSPRSLELRGEIDSHTGWHLKDQ